MKKRRTGLYAVLAIALAAALLLPICALAADAEPEQKQIYTQIIARNGFVLGLRADGTVACGGDLYADAFRQIGTWKDIRRLEVFEIGRYGDLPEGFRVSKEYYEYYCKRYGEEEPADYESSAADLAYRLWDDVNLSRCWCVVGYGEDGTVRLCNLTSDQLVPDEYYDDMNDEDLWSDEDVADWTGICQIALSNAIIAGLREDGTVVVKHWEEPTPEDYTQGEDQSADWSALDQVEQWEDVKKIYACYGSVVGLKKDGSVVATDLDWMWRNDWGPLDEWGREIAELYPAINRGAFAIRTDGTVLGDIENYEDEGRAPWEHVERIVYNEFALTDVDPIYGLRTDGRVVGVIEYDYDTVADYWEVYNWRDIVDIALAYDTPVGLCRNGTVKVITRAVNGDPFGDWDVSGWKNVKKVYSGDGYTFGLRTDGTVLATGGQYEECRAFFLDEVASWTDIEELFIPLNGLYVIGLKTDGTIVTAGDGFLGQQLPDAA